LRIRLEVLPDLPVNADKVHLELMRACPLAYSEERDRRHFLYEFSRHDPCYADCKAILKAQSEPS